MFGVKCDLDLNPVLPHPSGTTLGDLLKFFKFQFAYLIKWKEGKRGGEGNVSTHLVAMMVTVVVLP